MEDSQGENDGLYIIEEERWEYIRRKKPFRNEEDSFNETSGLRSENIG